MQEQDKVQCIFYAQGRCRYGNECRFAHGEKAGALPLPTPLSVSSFGDSRPLPVNQVFVGKLYDTYRTSKVTGAYLRGYFGVFGKVLSAFVVNDGYGFVSFAKAKDMEAVLRIKHSITNMSVPVRRANPCHRLPAGYGEGELSELDIKGMEDGAMQGREKLYERIYTDDSDERFYYDMQYTQNKVEKERYKDGDPVTQVLVKGLPATVTELYLEGYFGVFGTVRYVVSKGGGGGKEGGGQAYVSFSTDDDIEAIIRIYHKMDDTEVTLEKVAVPLKKGLIEQRGKKRPKGPIVGRDTCAGENAATHILKDARLRASLGLDISQNIPTEKDQKEDEVAEIGWHKTYLEPDRQGLDKVKRSLPRLIQTLPKAAVIEDRERRSLLSFLENGDTLPVPSVLKQMVLSYVPKNAGICISCSKVHEHVRKKRCCVCADCDAELVFICAGCNEGECSKHKERERIECKEGCGRAYHWRCRHHLIDNERCQECHVLTGGNHDYCDYEFFDEFMQREAAGRRQEYAHQERDDEAYYENMMG